MGGGLLPLSLTFSPSWGLGGSEVLTQNHMRTASPGLRAGGSRWHWGQFNIKLGALRKACGLC